MEKISGAIVVRHNGAPTRPLDISKNNLSSCGKIADADIRRFLSRTHDKEKIIQRIFYMPPRGKALFLHVDSFWFVFDVVCARREQRSPFSLSFP